MTIDHYQGTGIVTRKEERQRVHFLHIRKTGGTALKEALKTCRETANYHLKLHEHGFTLRDVPAGEKMIFTLRDPATRFVSGFYSRLREGRPRYDFPWNQHEKIAFSIFQTPNDLATALSSFDTKHREAAIRAMHGIRHINSSYWNWLGSYKCLMSRYQDILFIGFQENLDDDFNCLKVILSLDPAIRLPEDDIMAHRTPPGLATHLNNEARKNLSNWYKLDYQCYQCCRTMAERINRRPAT